MNSMELIQSVCGAWLSSQDQTGIKLTDMQGILRAINLTQGQVWRSLPVHYQRQTISLEFYGPAEGVVTVPDGYGSKTLSGIIFPAIMDVLTFNGEPLTFEGEPLIFNGGSVYENPRPFCTIVLDGDAVPNQFNGTNLIHPYFGQSTGSISATLYNDSRISPWLIERVISPVTDRISRRQYVFVSAHDPAGYGGHWCRTICTRRLIYDGVERTLFELPPKHSDVVSLSMEALVAPVNLNYGSSQRPVSLAYGDEVANIIITATGDALVTHPLFARDRISPAQARADADRVLRQLSHLSPAATSQGVTIGTPCGF